MRDVVVLRHCVLACASHLRTRLPLSALGGAVSSGLELMGGEGGVGAESARLAFVAFDDRKQRVCIPSAPLV